MGEYPNLDGERGLAPFSLIAPPVVDLRGRLPATGEYSRRDISSIKYIVIHHSGTDVDSSAEQIARYHIGLSWPSIGYHYIVRWDGTIEWANDLEVMSYNVASRNHEVVGICLPGDYTKRKPRPAQLEAAKLLIASLLAGPLPGREVVGHSQIALPGYETSCPGNLMDYIRGG